MKSCSLIYLVLGVSLLSGIFTPVSGKSITPCITENTRDVINPSGRILIRIHPNLTRTYYIYGLVLLYVASQSDITKTYRFGQVGNTLLRSDDTGKVIGKAEYSAFGITFWK